MRRSAALLLPLALVGCPSSTTRQGPPPPPPAPKADLVLVGGQVVTLADGVEGTAIAAKDGVVLDVADDTTIQKYIGPDTKVVGLKGRTAVPGLSDAHMHLAGLGVRRFGIDLVGTQSLEEVKARVAKAVADAKEGQWIRGRGWDQNDWPSFSRRRRKFPSARDLDRVAPNHPVVLTRIDGHAIWVNSKAMKMAGISRRTKTPKGGEIVKRRGRPEGVFIDNAMSLVREKMPPLTTEELERAILLGQRECLVAGLTQVQDMGTDVETIEVMKKLDAAGELKVRAYVMHDGAAEDLAGAIRGGPIVAEGDSRLTVRGVKFYMDGALGSRGAALLEPYDDDRRNKGLLLLEPAVFEARVRTVDAAGFQVATHAIGDRANQIVLDVYERVFGAEAATKRPRVEHAQILTEVDLARFGRLGVLASMQPTHATSDMEWAEQRVGSERIKGAYAWQSLLTSNATVAFGSDAPVEDISPILGLYAATTRKDQFGFPEDGWLPPEKVTARQALEGFTTGAAWAAFREDEAGRLTPGRVADITVLDKNPLTSSEDLLVQTQVMLTIVGGKIEYARAGADAPPAAPETVKTSTTTTSTTGVGQ
ncbi:MAG: amidohydrolase [Deltaproteobacteria bacterium]